VTSLTLGSSNRNKKHLSHLYAERSHKLVGSSEDAWVGALIGSGNHTPTTLDLPSESLGVYKYWDCPESVTPPCRWGDEMLWSYCSGYMAEPFVALHHLNWTEITHCAEMATPFCANKPTKISEDVHM